MGGVTISTKLILADVDWEVMDEEERLAKVIAVTHSGIRFDMTPIVDSGLLDLMIDYNLSWESVYNIVKEAIDGVEDDG